jgi:hypothetical protein
LDLFTGPRAWDLTQKAPLTDDQPAEIRARIIERDRKSASHLAVHMLDGALPTAWATHPPDCLWLLERLERQRRQPWVRLHKGQDAHPRHYLLGQQLDRHVNALLRQRQRYLWVPAHNRTPVVQAPVGLTLVTYENPPGIHAAEERVRAFKTGPHGGHFIPWEPPMPGSTTCAGPFRASGPPRSPITNPTTIPQPRP